MNRMSPIQQLSALQKESMDEDAIWHLHVMNKDEEAYRSRTNIRDSDIQLTRINIDFLNSTKSLKEIKTHIFNTLSNQNDNLINDYLDDISDFKSSLRHRSRDIEKYKENPRLLAFALNILLDTIDIRSNRLDQINNRYFLFLYMIFITLESRDVIKILNSIEEKFSTILSKYSSHFKDEKDSEFYIWAKKYMDSHPGYQSKQYTPMTSEEYKNTLNIIFDRLLYENQHIYDSLKDKLNNAWYQKSYRQRNKGKKNCHYTLTLKAQEALHKLAFKRKLTEDQAIEQLINEAYIKECVDYSGQLLY